MSLCGLLEKDRQSVMPDLIRHLFKILEILYQACLPQAGRFTSRNDYSIISFKTSFTFPTTAAICFSISGD
ncbi:MAG: hypothetical protein KAI99_06335, partial [Cyclobacteriaceae bacterium]|nr:hypothetical protein [Cyclobacteriaceae bacterium]